MRESRKNEILWFLSLQSEGFTWAELIRHFPKETLGRHLKKLVEAHIVEKTVELKIEGRRGLRSRRYKILSNVRFYYFQPLTKDGKLGKKVNGKVDYIRHLPTKREITEETENLYKYRKGQLTMPDLYAFKSPPDFEEYKVWMKKNHPEYYEDLLRQNKGSG